MPAHRLLAFALALVLPLTACNDDASRSVAADHRDEPLPAPANGTHGGVTGMPDSPGPGPVGPPQPDASALEVADETLPPSGTVETDAAPADPVTEPTAQDAVAVIRDYYAAIDRRDFAHAYALWSDDGRASNQTPQQFADGFAETAGVSVDIQAPGPVDAGAGQRYIDVPVTLTATMRDGSQQRFAGTYTLRRSVIDGATPEQRAWRIGSAHIREAKP